MSELSPHPWTWHKRGGTSYQINDANGYSVGEVKLLGDAIEITKMSKAGIPDPAALVESHAELLEFAKLAKDEGYHSPSRVSRMIARAEAARGEP